MAKQEIGPDESGLEELEMIELEELDTSAEEPLGKGNTLGVAPAKGRTKAKSEKEPAKAEEVAPLPEGSFEEVPDGGVKVGENLYVRMVRASDLREQDINAQQMDPTKFERLVENVRQRGALESMPYVHQPGGDGVMSIISGHHRAMAAREAGLPRFPVLVDTSNMSRSLVRAKQIAHNELSGSPDEEILRRMIAEIDNVDDLLMTGLDEEFFTDEEESQFAQTPLSLPHAEFEWRMTTLLFLPEQMERLEELAVAVPPETEMIGVAGYDSFEEFSRAMVEFSQVSNIKNMASVVDRLTSIALSEVDRLKQEQEQGAAEDEQD